MSAPISERLSERDYLTRERQAETKSEYLIGTFGEYLLVAQDRVFLANTTCAAPTGAG